MVPDRSVYQPGDTASFNFYSPFTGARALLVWGNRLSRRSRTTGVLPAGSQSLMVDVGEECIGGCTVSIVISSPTQSGGIMLPVDLATSSLFDATLPQRIVSQHILSVGSASGQLTVSVAVDDADLTPGSAAGFMVSLTDDAGAAVSGEVAIFVVDQAFLDVVPHPTTDLHGSFQLDLTPGSMTTASNVDRLIGGSTYEFSKERIQSLAAKDPWVGLSQGTWAIQPGQRACCPFFLTCLRSRSNSSMLMPLGRRAGIRLERRRLLIHSGAVHHGGAEDCVAILHTRRRHGRDGVHGHDVGQHGIGPDGGDGRGIFGGHASSFPTSPTDRRLCADGIR